MAAAQTILVDSLILKKIGEATPEDVKLALVLGLKNTSALIKAQPL